MDSKVIRVCQCVRNRADEDMLAALMRRQKKTLMSVFVIERVFTLFIQTYINEAVLSMLLQGEVEKQQHSLLYKN